LIFLRKRVTTKAIMADLCFPGGHPAGRGKRRPNSTEVRVGMVKRPEVPVGTLVTDGTKYQPDRPRRKPKTLTIIRKSNREVGEGRR